MSSMRRLALTISRRDASMVSRSVVVPRTAAASDAISRSNLDRCLTHAIEDLSGGDLAAMVGAATDLRTLRRASARQPRRELRPATGDRTYSELHSPLRHKP